MLARARRKWGRGRSRGCRGAGLFGSSQVENSHCARELELTPNPQLNYRPRQIVYDKGGIKIKPPAPN